MIKIFEPSLFSNLCEMYLTSGSSKRCTFIISVRWWTKWNVSLQFSAGLGMCELMRPNSAGYGGEYGDVWVDIRHQFVGMASAGHTGESDSWLSCHTSNGWLWWWRWRRRLRWTCPGSIKEQGLGPRTQSRVMCGSAGCYHRPSGKSSKARSVSDVAEWQQPAVPIFVPLLLLL